MSSAASDSGADALRDSAFSRGDLDRFAQEMSEDATRARSSFTAILATVAELLGETELDELLRKVIDHTIRTTRTERGLLLLDGPEGLTVRTARDRRGHDLGPEATFSRRIPDTVLGDDRPIISRASRAGDVLDLSGSVAALRLRKVMCAPVRSRGRVLGVLYVDSEDRGPPFTPADLVLFHAQAGLLGMAVERNRLFAERVEARHMEHQMSVARRIQQGLLPRTPLEFGPTVVAGTSRPTEKVGGDFYDSFPLDASRIVVCVGEAAGIGIGPALVMSNVRAQLRGLLQVRGTLTGLYGRMNRALCEDLTEGMFASLFVAVYARETGLLEYQNAGQTAPLLLNPETGVCRSLAANAPALGVIDDISAGPCPAVAVVPGELLLCCTDGVTDRHDARNQLYGAERLEAALRAAVDVDPDPSAIVEAVRCDCERFAGGVAPHDDMTLLVARF